MKLFDTIDNISKYFYILSNPIRSQLNRTCGFNNSQRSSHSKIPRHQYTHITFTLVYSSLKSQNIEAQKIYIT